MFHIDYSVELSKWIKTYGSIWLTLGLGWVGFKFFYKL